MKTLALDLGDRWTGVAISDPSGILSRPYETVETRELIGFLQKTIQNEGIKTIVVGYPKTMRGTESDQTRRIKDMVESLKQEIAHITWELFDERLTSKQASSLKKTKTKEDKQQIHAIAAAIILETFLEYRRLKELL